MELLNNIVEQNKNNYNESISNFESTSLKENNAKLEEKTTIQQVSFISNVDKSLFLLELSLLEELSKNKLFAPKNIIPIIKTPIIILKELPDFVFSFLFSSNTNGKFYNSESSHDYELKKDNDNISLNVTFKVIDETETYAYNLINQKTSNLKFTEPKII
mgnify:CR=1 FL=1